LGFWLVFFEIPYFEVKDVDPLEDHGAEQASNNERNKRNIIF
jgi:hypothetical protein